MVVLNCYGKIEPICISEKLKLFISNPPEEKNNEWQSELSEELKLVETASNLFRKRVGIEPEQSILKLYTKVFPDKPQPVSIDGNMIKELAENMICFYFDYDYGDMPLGGWDTNCFDGRLCEEDCAEKVIDLINFLSYRGDVPARFPEPTPQWAYSSNHDDIDHFRFLWGGEKADAYIQSLKKWGELFDNLLIDKNDYLLLDYLLNSIHKDNEYNEYHLMKSFSLCQLFLEKENESELDRKLPSFIAESDSNRRELSAQFFRRLRNKIAHGDFVAFENIIEEYAESIMDGCYAFDYSEYSRKNWVLLHVCCQLDDIVRQLIYLLLYNREKLEQIKKGA